MPAQSGEQVYVEMTTTQHPATDLPQWFNGPISEDLFVIIAGSYRCGTTSMFSYLADHPQINPSLIKEPEFFFSRRMRTQPSPYPKGLETWAYLDMFRKQRTNQVKLEGTASYLADPGSAERIKEALPNARIVISLRDPVERLVSWYKFILHRGWWPASACFAEWIQTQRDDPRPVAERPYHLQALEHGFYSSYIRHYQDVFGTDRVKVLWFDQFRASPVDTMQSLCRYAGVDPDFYANYRFRKQNEAMSITRPRALAFYRKLHGAFFRLLKPFPKLWHRARVLLFGVIEPRIIGFFTGPAASHSFENQLLDELRQFYSSDLEALEEVTGRRPYWADEFEQSKAKNISTAKR